MDPQPMPARRRWLALAMLDGFNLLCIGFAGLASALLAHSATLFPRRSADSARLYLLDLQVMPPAGAVYQVTIRQLIRRHPSNMPSTGAVIPVKYLPEQPQVLVALLNPEDRAPDER